MEHAPTGANCTAASPDCSGAASGLLAAAERQERLFAALRASLADETLPALDADVRAHLVTMTWAQLAESLRVTGAAAWRRGLRGPATAVPHQVLWLLVGGDAPSPRQLPGGCHRALVDALQNKIEKQFVSEAFAEDFRAKRGSGTFDRPAARVRVASCAPWRAPVDASLLRGLLIDPTGASAALGAALARAASSTGMPFPPLAPPLPLRTPHTAVGELVVERQQSLSHDDPNRRIVVAPLAVRATRFSLRASPSSDSPPP